MDKTERDRILLFLEALLTERANAKMFIAGNGVKALVDLMVRAH